MARGHRKRPQPRAERCPHGVAPAPRCGRTVAFGDLRASQQGWGHGLGWWQGVRGPCCPPSRAGAWGQQGQPSHGQHGRRSTQG